MKICIYGASSNAIDNVFINAGELLGETIAKNNHSVVFGGGGRLAKIKKGGTAQRDVLSGQITLSYDCPYGQVMSYDMLRIVMIGYAKF